MRDGAKQTWRYLPREFESEIAMSLPDETNNMGRDEEGLRPTANFSGSVKEQGSRIGPFRIERQLSRGAMGMVYLAHDTKLDRPVAIKSLPADVMSSPVIRSRFQREARLLASLNHPNIATIYEELEEAEGVAYLILEYVPGQTLAERIATGELNLNEALSIALQIAEAMSAAHDMGIIHRDLKPSNVKITPEGRVKVLDFGIAKLIRSEVSARQTTAVTQPGQAIGTPGYMSPEQALGKAVDRRTDIWSFGCVLYEMLTSKRPFSGETTSDLLESILTSEPDWESLPAGVGPCMRDLIRKCLQKGPEHRYPSAAELYQDLLDYHAILTAPSPKALDIKALLRSLRKPRIATCAVLVFLALCVTAFWLINRSAKVRWARKALPEIERLIEQDKYLSAFSLAQKAEKYIPEDPILVKLWPRICRDYSVITTPPGADVFFKEYSAIDAQWQYLRRSPLENIRFPRGLYRWRIEKQGFETRECAAGEGSFASKVLNIDLWQQGGSPSDMVRIAGGTIEFNLYPVSRAAKPVEAPAYWIDKYEVTNEQFKEFVDKGGYQTAEYWKHKFPDQAKELSWEEAMRGFRDKTGRPGPAMWEGGTYPKGQDKFPVCGVSWYEAAAYAEFVGKRLPTIYHWSNAACSDAAIAIIPLSNFGAGGPAPVGSHPGIGFTGLYDMAGNVKEWCWNATDGSGQHRYILGGAWGEQSYMFSHTDVQSAWDRSPVNGFRCAYYPNEQRALPDALFDPIEYPSLRDYSRETPVSDEEFKFYKKLYAYDRTKLDAKVTSVDESSDYWRIETITFDAAYGGERVTAYLFLPKGIKPPYQTVVFFPGWGAFVRPGLDPGSYFWDFIIMSGRAFMYPVYKGTYERKVVGGLPGSEARPIAYQDWVIQLSKDLRRSIDYLETRDDIETGKVAYYGFSMGARLGPIMMAMEDRFKAGVFAVGGFPTHLASPPAADPINFAPRVKVPLLMVNGKEDAIFPLKASQMPMYELLGAPDEDKKHLLYPGGHGLWALFSRQIRKDVLDWLDRYLGPVD